MILAFTAVMTVVAVIIIISTIIAVIVIIMAVLIIQVMLIHISRRSVTHISILAPILGRRM